MMGYSSIGNSIWGDGVTETFVGKATWGKRDRDLGIMQTEGGEDVVQDVG